MSPRITKHDDPTAGARHDGRGGSNTLFDPHGRMDFNLGYLRHLRGLLPPDEFDRLAKKWWEVNGERLAAKEEQMHRFHEAWLDIVGGVINDSEDEAEKIRKEKEEQERKEKEDKEAEQKAKEEEEKAKAEAEKKEAERKAAQQGLKQAADKGRLTEPTNCSGSTAVAAAELGNNDLHHKDANAQVQYMTANWEAVTAEEAQRLANEGILVVAVTQNPGDHGHTMVVVPGKLQIASDGKPYPMVAGGAMSAGGSSDGSKSAGQCWPRQSSPGRPGRDQIQYFTPR